MPTGIDKIQVLEQFEELREHVARDGPPALSGVVVVGRSFGHCDLALDAREHERGGDSHERSDPEA